MDKNVGKVFNLSGEGNMYSSIYDPTGKSTDIFAYIDDALKPIKEFCAALLDEHTIYQDLMDSKSGGIQDNNGEDIIVRQRFEIL